MAVEIPNPFIIRGHHLEYYALLVRDHSDVGIVSPHYLASIGINGILDLLEEMYAQRETYQEEGIWYIEDLVSQGGKGSDRYYQQLYFAFSTFVDLPDDHPVQIVEGLKDEICKGCAVGKHCSMSKSLLGRTTTTDRDVKFVDDLLECTKFLNLTDKINVSETVAHYWDGQSRKVRVVNTCAGTLRKIIFNSGVADWDDYVAPNFKKPVPANISIED